MMSGDLRVGNRVVVDAPLAGVHRERGMIIRASYDTSTSMADFEVEMDTGGAPLRLNCYVSGGVLHRVIIKGRLIAKSFYAADVRLVLDPGSVTSARKRKEVENELAGDPGASAWITQMLYPF